MRQLSCHRGGIAGLDADREWAGIDMIPFSLPVMPDAMPVRTVRGAR
ncbi:MAG: hypothetical protein WCX84_00010 [Syntrophales bacterium]|jgi:hypothetical protein|nr:hypothetical protein [Syntrophales bacterium]NLN60049.1 hypothetical protein [Deltaproteobacteria bacterium]